MHGHRDLVPANRPHRADHRQAPAPARSGAPLPAVRDEAQPLQPLADLLLRARAADPPDPRALGLAPRPSSPPTEYPGRPHLEEDGMAEYREVRHERLY